MTKLPYACIAVLVVAVIVPDASSKEPLAVFIMAGQSNMQGHAANSTLPHMASDPQTKALLARMVDDAGNPRVCNDVWISSIGNTGDEQDRTGRLTSGFGAGAVGDKFGPEWTFGIAMQQQLERPILIIKTAWGGKSLHTDFRPPTAGAYQFSEPEIERLRSAGKDVDAEQKLRSDMSGVYYRLMIEHVQRVLADLSRVYPDYNEDAGYELAGFVWFQGWNDMVDRGVYPNRDQPGGYDEYSRLLAELIRDMRKDLNAPSLPVVIGVLGVGGPTSEYLPPEWRYAAVHDNFRLAMAAPAEMPEFRGNVAVVLTENYWDAELDELKSRAGQLNAKARQLEQNAAFSVEERTAELARFRQQLYTPCELETLKGSSNAAYHYLGSAKIMAQIGHGFADALFQLQPPHGNN